MGAGMMGNCLEGAARLRDRVLGLPGGCRAAGTEVVLTGGFDELPGFIAWERRNLAHAHEVPFAEVRAVRAWLDSEAQGRWTCTMPEAGIDAAWSVPPAAQIVRLADAADAEALRRQFPGVSRLARA